MDNSLNFMDSIIMQQQKEFVNKKDNVIKDALVRNGVDILDLEFLKSNLSRVISNEFQHYYLFYGTEKQVRIISIQECPTITNNQSDKNFTITATCKYY